MQDTIVAVFERFEQARDAMTALLDNGFERGAIQLNPHADATGVRRASSAGEQPGAPSGIAHFLRTLFGMQEQHADMYAEAIRRGSSILTVLAGSEARRDEAMRILMRFHPLDLDERVERWRREGWSGHVERRTPSGQGTPDEGPLRVYAVPGSDAAQPGAAQVRRNSDYGDTLASADDAGYRSHWRNVYGADSGRYEDLDAAYRYGALAPARLGMQDARWEEAEAALRADWQARHPDQPWERVREAVRYGARGLGNERRR